MIISFEHIEENCKTIEDVKKLHDEVIGEEEWKWLMK